jgi:O-antigen/teichoic acid export membrane protein
LRVEAARGVVWSAIDAWGTRIITLLVLVVLGRELSPAAFGLVALGVAVVDFGRLLVDQGFSRTIVQRTEIDDSHLDTAFWTAVTSGALLTTIAMVLAPTVATHFGEPQLTSVLRALSLNLVLASLTTTQTAILQRDLRFRGLAARRLFSVIASGGMAVTLALLGAGVWALVAQQLTHSIVAASILWAVSPWRPGFRASRRRFKEMFGFASTTLGIEIVGYFGRRGDDLLVGAFLGATALGVYSVAFRILTIVIELFTSTINAVAFPVFSRLQNDPPRLRRALHSATSASSAVAFPAFLGLAVLAPEFVRAVLGEQWERSADVLQILALVGVLRSVTYFNRSLLLALGKPAWELGWSSLTAATKVMAFAIGYHWGLEGVAWAVVIQGYLLAPAGVWLINRATPIDPVRYASQFIRPVACSLAMVAVIVPVRMALPDGMPATAALAIGVVVGAVVYTGTLAVAAPALLRELVATGRGALPTRRSQRVP